MSYNFNKNIIFNFLEILTTAMSQFDNEDKPLNFDRPQRALDSFIEYSVSERQRQQDSGEDFNPRLFDQAVELINRKLERLESEVRT